jgi:hypothetical protein
MIIFAVLVGFAMGFISAMVGVRRADRRELETQLAWRRLLAEKQSRTE